MTEQGRTHRYEDERLYNHDYYTENKVNIIERVAHYNQEKRKTHKCVKFSDSSKHWVPLSEATELHKIPLKERIWKKQ